MTAKSCRAGWLSALLLLPILGCIEVENLTPGGDPNDDPNNWPVLYGPAGGTAIVTVTADVYLGPSARQFIEFRLNPDGEKTWWNPENVDDPNSVLQQGWQTLSWDVEVAVDADNPKTFRVLGYDPPFLPDLKILAESKFWLKPE